MDVENPADDDVVSGGSGVISGGSCDVIGFSFSSAENSARMAGGMAGGIVAGYRLDETSVRHDRK